MQTFNVLRADHTIKAYFAAKFELGKDEEFETDEPVRIQVDRRSGSYTALAANAFEVRIIRPLSYPDVADGTYALLTVIQSELIDFS